MRLPASWFIMAIPFVLACGTKCDITHCPADITRSNASVIYHDGSGNGYIFAGGSVEYRPVQLEESSSGKYSGGAPFTRPIDARTYGTIANALNAAIDAKSTHIPNRTMLSGAIRVKCGNESRDWIIAPGSAALVTIETLLQELRNSPPIPSQP